MNPIWKCDAETHGRHCKCGDNLQKQLEVWRAEIVSADPFAPCPYCGSPCECDTVDVGVGLMQCGPYHCQACGAFEIGADGADGCRFTPLEIITGWYEPSKPVSPLANTVQGILVDHKAAHSCPACNSPRVERVGQRVQDALTGRRTVWGYWNTCLDCWFCWGAVMDKPGVLPAGVEARESDLLEPRSTWR